jgi:P27 family predicted phage terminase small subunit
MSGPPPTPNHLKLLRGNPGKRPIKSQPEVDISPEIPAPPEFLTPAAKDEWWRLASELHRLRLLTQLDVGVFAVYCQSYSNWVEAERELAKAAAADPETGGLLVEGSHHQVIANPLLRVARNAADNMMTCGTQLGLTPLARSRISIPHPPSGSGKFTGLLGGGDEPAA